MSNRKRFQTPLLCCALLFGLQSLMVTTAAAQPGSKNSLPEVAAMFLGTWHGTGKTPDGEAFSSELIFTWTLDQNFIQVENYVRNDSGRKRFALTFYGWQPVLGKVVFWSFDRDGTINEGFAEMGPEGLTHRWRSFRKGGEIVEWGSTMNKQDEQHIIFRQIDNRGAEVFSVTYKKR